MIVALVDNGSLEPAAQRNLRAVAAALSARTGVAIEAVSWKHSDRVPPAALDGVPAWTLARWVRKRVAQGERDFLIVPFFISAQGAIGTALRGDLEKLSAELGGFTFAFTDGLAARNGLVPIVADRVRETIRARKFSRPPVIIVDHGGPAPASAALRDKITGEVRALLGTETGPVAAASLEGAAFVHNRPLLTDALTAPGFDSGHVIVAPLFLAPGRHAGPGGDVAKICRAAPASCHLTALVGDHPAVVEIFAAALRDAIDGRRTDLDDAILASNPAEAGSRVN